MMGIFLGLSSHHKILETKHRILETIRDINSSHDSNDSQVRLVAQSVGIALVISDAASSKVLRASIRKLLTAY
jgi:hypothetical protein